MMTKAQLTLYWKEWAAVRRVRPDADRDLITVETLGSRVSSKQLSNAGFDQILAAFRAISRPADLKAQLKQVQQPKDRALWRIGWLAQCLRLYVADPAGYIAQLSANKVRAGADGNWDLSALDERPRYRTDSQGAAYEVPSELQQLLMTANARLQLYRKAAGHSLHEMSVAAGVKCYCAPCKRLGGQRPKANSKKPALADCPF